MSFANLVIIEEFLGFGRELFTIVTLNRIKQEFN